MTVVKCIKISVFLILILFSCIGSVFAQNQADWWHTLERGKQSFRQGSYGSALLSFEDAKRQRRAMYERMERDLINLLSSREARRMGDSLDWVERYIRERGFAAAGEALAELYFRFPDRNYNNSVSAALTALGTLKDYPEAEYWIGEVYLMEGEHGLALTQFQKALDMRVLFENPGFATEIIYKIANIRQVRQEFTQMERTLFLILANDNLWTGNNPRQAETGGNTFERRAMARTLQNDGINRFLTMYRYGHTESMQAHRILGFHYFSTGRHDRAREHLMFAFLIQNTAIIDELIRRQFDFTFSTLEALAAEFAGNRLVTDYVEKNEYYKTAYYLAASLFATQRRNTAMYIWGFLSTQNDAGEWRVRAASQRENPRVESPILMQ